MRYVLTFLLVFVCFSTSALALTTKYASGEATVLDFDWKPIAEISLDIAQSKPLTRWKKKFSSELRGWAEFDLDGSDRTREVIIDEWDFPSGGRAFLLMRKRLGGNWEELASFRGAPIFSERDTVGYPELQVYWRSGDIVVTRMRMKNGRYYRIDEYTIPRMINDECFYRRWQVLNRMKITEGYEKCFGFKGVER
jgi:hypothetical protein